MLEILALGESCFVHGRTGATTMHIANPDTLCAQPLHLQSSTTISLLI